MKDFTPFPTEITVSKDEEKRRIIEFMSDGRIAKWNDLVKMASSKATVISLYREDKLQRVGWGAYQLCFDLRADLSHDDDAAFDGHLESFSEVTSRSRRGVICLMSAAAFHDLTLDVPSDIWLGLPHGTHAPRIDYPTVKPVFFRNREMLEYGIDYHRFQGMTVPVTDLERTVTDLYRYSSRLADDTLPRKALAAAFENPGFDREKLNFYAKRFNVRQKVRTDMEILDLVNPAPAISSSGPDLAEYGMKS